MSESLTAIHLLPRVLRQIPSVRAINAVWFRPAPPYEQRAQLSSSELQLVQSALTLRDVQQMPFWDAMLLSATRGDSVPLGILRSALYHQEILETVTVAVDQTIETRLAELTQQSTADRVLGLSSRVDSEGSTMHLPLLDFHCADDEFGRALARASLEALLPSGFHMLSSGRSLHGWGRELLSRQELVSFLGRALLLSPVTDRSYIGHQLVQGYCVLRIGPSPGRSAPLLLSER
jgi:hypothetical protein